MSTGQIVKRKKSVIPPIVKRPHTFLGTLMLNLVDLDFNFKDSFSSISFCTWLITVTHLFGVDKILKKFRTRFQVSVIFFAPDFTDKGLAPPLLPSGKDFSKGFVSIDHSIQPILCTRSRGFKCAHDFDQVCICSDVFSKIEVFLSDLFANNLDTELDQYVNTCLSDLPTFSKVHLHSDLGVVSGTDQYCQL